MEPENKPLSIEELGDELCNYCPLDDNQKHVRSTSSGMPIMCEGSRCGDAYDNYLDSQTL